MDVVWKWKQQSLSPIWLFVTPWNVACQAPVRIEFSRQEYWRVILLQGIFPTQRSNPGFPHCRQILTMWPTREAHSSSVQSLSRVRLCNPMNRSTPGLPVHHQLPEFTQTHVHRVSDAIQPSHPLSSPSPPAFNLSQHQSLFQWVNSSHEVAKVLELQL